MHSLTWLTLLKCMCLTHCARILLIFPLPERSHYALGSSLARALAERGHNITMVSPFAEKIPPNGGSYEDVQLTGLYEEMQERLSTNKLNFFDLEEPNPFMNAIRFAQTCTEVELTLKHRNFQQLLKSNKTFDVVIVEQFLNDALSALSTYFQAPLILFGSTGPNFWLNSLSGNPSPTSYIPHILLKYSANMTFFERLINTWIYTFNELLHHFYVYPIQNQLIKKYISNDADIHEVLYNASLILVNSHPSTNQPVPKVPNMIEVGGLHIKPPQELPKELQNFLDGAEDGVIYFNMGSNVRSAQFPVSKRDAFLETFATLKEKVLWKWEEDSLPGQPSNVKVGKWFPQQDILAHPKIKLFITHGGLLSTTEAIYHGVPVLVIPIFGDQTINAKLAVANGYGRLVPYDQISTNLLKENILKILKHPKFKNEAKKRSEIFHDRLVSPMETAIYWVEYVIRYKGAPHLRVAGLDLSWYQYFLVDVVGFIMVAGLISLLVVYMISKRVYRQILLMLKHKANQKINKNKQD